MEFEGEEMVAAEVERSNKEVERDIEVEIDLGKMMRDDPLAIFFQPLGLRFPRYR